MNRYTEAQEGSKSRDIFKRLHKSLHNYLWSTDGDLFFVEKKPRPFVVALTDFKLASDNVTFSEVIAYNHFISLPMPYQIPVYIIEAPDDFVERPPVKHRFDVFKYHHGNWRPEPPDVDLRRVAKNLSWEGLELWEVRLRQTRRKQMWQWIKDNR